MNLETVLAVALAAAQEAIDVHRANLGRVAADEWAEKGLHDFVTRVDREAEARVIARIRSSFADHRFLAEEEATAPPADPPFRSGPDSPQSATRGPEPQTVTAARLGAALRQPGWLWVIDPLDGTTNYLHRYPAYAVSIAALFDGEPVVGAVMHGATGETWTATRGGGAFRDGERISVSATADLGQALIGTGFPFKVLDLMPTYLKQFERVMRESAGVRRAGSAALDLCHVASGYFDGFWELWLAPWDVAAGTLIVREAGGVVTRLDGDSSVIGSGALLAGNPHMHARLASLLNLETN